MLLSIEGEEGCGKTTLAYTAPTKVVGFAFDMGVTRALFGAKHKELFGEKSIKIIPWEGDKLPETKWDEDITIYELPQPVQLDSIRILGAMELWDCFIQLYVQALKDDSVRTIVVDTMTIARRVKADAYLQGLQANTKPGAAPRERLLQIEWGNTNDAIRSMYTAVAGVKKNMVAVHHLTDERKETLDKQGQVIQVLTGNRILEGLSQTYRFVDVAIRNSKKGAKVSSEFRKCGYNLSLEGLPIENATWPRILDSILNSLGGTLKIEEAV